MLKALKEESVSKKRKRKDRKWIRKMNWQYISFYYPSINASSLPLNSLFLQFYEFSMLQNNKRIDGKLFELQYTRKFTYTAMLPYAFSLISKLSFMKMKAQAAATPLNS